MRIMVRATYRRQLHYHGEEPQLIDAQYAEVPDGIVKRTFCESLIDRLPGPEKWRGEEAIAQMQKDGYFD